MAKSKRRSRRREVRTTKQLPPEAMRLEESSIEDDEQMDSDLARLAKRLGDVAAIDFFGAPEREALLR